MPLIERRSSPAFDRGHPQQQAGRPIWFVAGPQSPCRRPFRQRTRRVKSTIFILSIQVLEAVFALLAIPVHHCLLFRMIRFNVRM
jgi:hypothetical protein